MAYKGTRRKVFISYYKGDVTASGNFIDKWAHEEEVFIPKQLGVYDAEEEYKGRCLGILNPID